jgi:hypothetical protein
MINFCSKKIKVNLIRGGFMSLVQMYGNMSNDLSTKMLNERELFNLASAPMVIYKVKGKEDQPSTDDLYGEITQKEYFPGIELQLFFQNPALVMELIIFGLDIPEQITAYVDSQWMMAKLGRPFQPGDIIQPPHQRNQVYIVQNSFPNWTTEKFFKNTQWQVIAQKMDLSGYNLPKYLLWNECISHFAFEGHWKTEFLLDRKGMREQRSVRIYGDLDYFWNKGDFYEKYEVVNFNGTNNYVDFGNEYNYKANGFAIEVVIKPSFSENPYYESGIESGKELWENLKYPIMNKGSFFDVWLDNNKIINLTFNGSSYLTGISVQDNIWSVLLFNFDVTSGLIKIFLDGVLAWQTALSPYNFINTDSFLLGTDASKQFFYYGFMSNLRLFSRSLSDDEATSNEYPNLITRNYASF